jgi:small-conductance mechanosensitive channel
LLVTAVVIPVLAFSQSSSPPDSLSQQEVIRFLNETVDWYHARAAEQQIATNPGDILFVNDDRPIAEQIVRLSFEFARASAPLVNNSAASGGPSASPADSRRQALAQAASKLEDQYNKTRAELAGLREKVDSVPARQRKTVQAQIEEVQSELAALKVRQEALRNIMQFAGGAAEPGGLASEIEALERSVPQVSSSDSEATTNPSSKEGAAALASASAQRSEPSSFWGILRETFSLSGKLKATNIHIRRTDALSKSLRHIQDPLRGQVKDLVSRSEAIMNQPDSQDPAVLAQQKSTLDTVTARYRLVSAAALPLGKEAILLEVYKRNLEEWRAATKSRYVANIKNLLIRLTAFCLLIAIVLVVFALWQRAILRYVQDSQRRYQFLLLRRIALWIVVSMVITLALASQLGSLMTFAGLMTAGVAIALQNVILAVVGYFLLIGKFGVRVGDRVQVSGVYGKVAEIGLIRLHIMELTGTGTDAQPTGRVVAFSNSIVFQPNPGLFRQVPGTSFLWHEITLTFAADSDYRAVDQRLQAAVETALSDYAKDFELQRRQMERSLSFVSIGSLAPGVRFRFSTAGLEAVLRFPVESGKAAEIDDRVTREVLQAINQEPKLTVVAAEAPGIQPRPVAAGDRVA